MQTIAKQNVDRSDVYVFVGRMRYVCFKLWLILISSVFVFVFVFAPTPPLL